MDRAWLLCGPLCGCLQGVITRIHEVEDGIKYIPVDHSMRKDHRWPKLPICVGNDYSGVRLHIAILSKCMGNLNSSHNVMKNNKIHCLPQASCVVVTPCVYGGFWSRLEAN